MYICVVKTTVSCLYPLICCPICSIGHSDNSALDKSVLQNIMRHNMVVIMGVNTDVFALFAAPIKTGGKQAFCSPIAGKPMDSSILFSI